MPTKFFTLEEANGLLPQIKPLMSELLERRAKAVHTSQQMHGFWEEDHADKGGFNASRLTQEFFHIERLVDEIQAFGCVIKDLNGGLLDFLAFREGREVYLCWRYGEAKITHYHELHTGFSGRVKIE
ncbi:MAG: DUF2203 domain-containing protein [Chloroflexota bacterium]